MIVDGPSQTVVGNLGWVDKGALWTFDLRTKTEARIPIDGAQYLTVRAGSNGLFRLVHQESPDQAISIRRVGEPACELASLRLNGGQHTFNGDQALWQHVDPSVIIHTPDGTKLLLIDAAEGRVKEIDLSWYTNGNYDLGYQGLTDCMMLPSNERLIVSVQRSSALVVIDPHHNRPVGSINLGNRGGNPELRMRTASDFLASDYDTLCRVDVRSLSVKNSARLQDTATPNTQQFIGRYDIGEGVCVVARPFGGDVLLLDTKSFKVLGRAQIGDQPLDVSMISEASVIVRDWKTGQVAMGEIELERRYWRWPF